MWGTSFEVLVLLELRRFCSSLIDLNLKRSNCWRSSICLEIRELTKIWSINPIYHFRNAKTILIRKELRFVEFKLGREVCPFRSILSMEVLLSFWETRELECYLFTKKYVTILFTFLSIHRKLQVWTFLLQLESFFIILDYGLAISKQKCTVKSINCR